MYLSVFDDSGTKDFFGCFAIENKATMNICVWGFFMVVNVHFPGENAQGFVF